MNLPPTHSPIGSRVVRGTGREICRRREDERQEDCMERTDYISPSPHMPDCVTAKCPRDCGAEGGGRRRWRGGGSGVNWRKLSGGRSEGGRDLRGKERVSCGVGNEGDGGSRQREAG